MTAPAFPPLPTDSNNNDTNKNTANKNNATKFSTKLKGLKFMQRAEEKKIATATSLTTTTMIALTRDAMDKVKNDEHWTYEKQESEHIRKRKAIEEQLETTTNKRGKIELNPNFVMGRRSFGGMNLELEEKAREQVEKQLKAKQAIRDARANSNNTTKVGKIRKVIAKKPTSTANKKGGDAKKT